MRVLVTGGAGFIGSHLCERLLAEGADTAIIDDLNASYSPDLKRANLECIRQAGPVRFYACDISDSEQLSRIVATELPNVVIHLAARVGVRDSLVQPLLYERVNVGGTLNLLEACRQHRVGRFVFASSSSVYGAGGRIPFREDCCDPRPASVYAATKLAAETLCYAYSYLYGIQVVVLRLFSVYGPRQRPDLVLRKFTEMISRGEPIPLYGDGSSARDYSFVADIVEGIMASLGYQTDYDVFNLGSSEATQLGCLIRMLEHKLQKPAKICRLPAQAGDVPITCADITKARRCLNYDPRVPLGEGIDRFLEWHARLEQDEAS